MNENTVNFLTTQPSKGTLTENLTIQACSDASEELLEGFNLV